MQALLHRQADLSCSRHTTDLLHTITTSAAHFRAMRPDDPLLPSATILIAQASAFGYPDEKLLEQMLRKLPPAARCKLGIYENQCLALAEAVLALSKPNYERAKVFVSRAMAFRGFLPAPLLAFAYQLRSKIFRKRGQYDRAYRDITRGCSIAVTKQLTALHADLTVDQAWLEFQLNRPSEAELLLNNAEVILKHAGDNRRLGDIDSARARMEQRVGNLRKAASHCAAALDQYRICSTLHRGFVRGLINQAKILWLLVRQGLAARSELSVALSLLAEAERLCITLNRRASQARAIYVRAYVLAELEEGSEDGASKINEAIKCADAVVRFGEVFRNPLWQARGYALLATLHIRALDLGIAHSEPTYVTATRAVSYALQGLRIMRAKRVVDRRIRAKLRTWAGLAYLYREPADLIRAERSLRIAESMVFAMPDDYVTEDVQHLRRAYLRAISSADLHYETLMKLVARDRPWETVEQLFKEWYILEALKRNKWKIGLTARNIHVKEQAVSDVYHRYVENRSFQVQNPPSAKGREIARPPRCT